MAGRLASPKPGVGDYRELRESIAFFVEVPTHEHSRDLPLLPHRSNKADSIKTSILSTRIKSLGIACGIPGTITSYCFRHLVAQQLQRQGGESTIRLWLLIACR